MFGAYQISSVKATQRGCRGRRRKTTADNLSGLLFPSKNGLVSESTSPARRELVHRNARNVHIASSSLLNIEIVTSAMGIWAIRPGRLASSVWTIKG